MRSATYSFCAKETCLVSHRNAPLTPAGRLRLVRRCRYRPIAHVAAEAGVSRQCLSKWVSRYRRDGEAGLTDHSSTPLRRPTQLDADIVGSIEQLRRTRKWSARLIAVELTDQGHRVSPATVGRWLVRLGLNRRRWLDVDGEPLRQPGRITARYRGHMVHLDVKKVGRIPDGGGWRTHGRGSDQHRAVDRAKVAGARAGFVYLHSAVDGFSRLAYTEHLPDETAKTAVGFWARARAFFAAHGITRITRVVTDNGSCYRSKAFTRATGHAGRHQLIKPFTPKHNGKVERYQRILTEELLYARPFTSEADRAHAIEVWNVHYNYHRPHTAAGNQPPALRLGPGVTNVLRSYN
jgi:transposase InsO family protein